MRRQTACGVELIRWPRIKGLSPHEVKVRVIGLPHGADTLTRRFGSLRRAVPVAKAVAHALGCSVQKIDMREHVRDSQK